MSSVRARTRLLLLAVLVAAGFAAAAVGVPHSPGELRAAVSACGVAAPFVAVAAWTVLTPVLFSGALLAVVAGLAFGIGPGFGVGLAGATLGGVAAFALARRLGHGPAQALSGERLQRLQERLGGCGFRAVACARAAPGVPATLLNYACGLSRIRLRDFVAGSAVGGAPRILAYTVIGASGGDVTSAPAIAGLALIAALTVAGALAALLRRRRPIAAAT